MQINNPNKQTKKRTHKITCNYIVKSKHLLMKGVKRKSPYEHCEEQYMNITCLIHEEIKEVTQWARNDMISSSQIISRTTSLEPGIYKSNHIYPNQVPVPKKFDLYCKINLIKSTRCLHACLSTEFFTVNV